MDECGYSLEMPFLTDNNKWVEGFECGLLYGELLQGVSKIENFYHNKNVKQIKAMAEQYGYTFEKGIKKAGWTHITLTNTRDVWDEFIDN